METRIEKEVRFLKIYAFVATLVCGVLLLTAFGIQTGNQKFEEINVERINIVEKDGTLRMVISNQERQHPGIANGKIIERDIPRPPGILFFNHLGDEMGGLAYGDNGETGHWGSLTFDKVRGDQTMGFRHLEGDDGAYQSGLEIWQQPDIPGDVMLAQLDSVRKIEDKEVRKAAIQQLIDRNELTQRRLFIGKSRSNAAMLEMLDIKGNTRIVMQVGTDGLPKLEFLDEHGKVIYSIPENM